MRRLYRVTDPAGNWSEATDDLVVETLSPPDETTFSPGFGSPHHIRAFFDNVHVNGALYDDFDSGVFDSSKWQYLPEQASYENGEVRFENTWFPKSESIWMMMTSPENADEFKATVRVDSITGDSELFGARIIGQYCRDSKGEVFARIGIRGSDTFYTVYSEYFDGDTWIEDYYIPYTSLGPVSQGNKYELTLNWNESTRTFNFLIDGLDDDVYYSAEFTLPGSIDPTDNPSRGISILSWVSIDGTSPTFDWEEVPGANHYRIRINGLEGKRLYQGYAKTPPYRLPPGILKPNGIYQYEIYALRDNQWFEWDNVSRSERNAMRFIAGVEEAQNPYVDLDSHGVYTWTDREPLGENTWFYLKIHDAQGVPGNIESAKVLLPDGTTEVNLYLDYTETATSALYKGLYLGSTPPGTYEFTVVDKDGNSHTVTEDLTPEPTGYPAESALVPAESALIGSTAVDFNWDDVPGASFYQVNFYDQNFRSLFNVKTTEGEYSLPEGLLDENSLYHYRILTRGEFFEDNLDNGSASPPGGTWRSKTFITTTAQGSELPQLNLDSYGVSVWHAPDPVDPINGPPRYWLDFSAMVTDADGVPQNIARVEVTYPDGTTTRALKYADSPDWGYNYVDNEYYPDPALIQDTTNSTGIYIFRVVDFDGNEVTLQDTLTDVFTDSPSWVTNVSPADGTVFYTTTPTIYWDADSNAAYYKVRILTAWNTPTVHWSPELTDTQYTIPDGILSKNTTYGFRVYAYRVDA